MTQFTSVRAMPSAESRLIAGVCAAHMMSHYYLLMLAPLLAFVRADFNVSYTELALALTVFNVVSGVLQTPVGFLVDRIGARLVLIVGLALSSTAFAIAGLFNSYWVFIAMYGVAGLGNTTYHPADMSAPRFSALSFLRYSSHYPSPLPNSVAPAEAAKAPRPPRWAGSFCFPPPSCSTSPFSF
jgi:MFS family permease